MSDASDTTDYSKHTDEQLREGIRKIDENEPRIASESESADDAARDQRDAMERELQRRQQQ